jgi:glycosyltransferase involved in cell wall biosynthesis
MTIAEAIAARSRGRGVLLHAHEMLPGGFRGALMRRAAWSLDQVVAVSEASGEPLRWRGRSPRIVYEGAPVPDRPAEIRADPAPFTVGTVAVVSTRKGSDIYVEAARRLMAASDDFRFEMIGPANEAVERRWAAELLECARQIGVVHRRRADTFECYRSWDAFVLPSRADPFPIAMLEAMASGLPVIGARRDGIAEQIADGCGILVEPENPAALAGAITSLAALGAGERRALGEAARERVASRFNLERQSDAMHEAYLAALGGAGG